MPARDFNHVYITSTAITHGRELKLVEACMDDREAKHFLSHMAISQVSMGQFVVFGPEDDPSVLIAAGHDNFAVLRPNRYGQIAWAMVGIFCDSRAQLAYMDAYVRYAQKQFSLTKDWRFDENKLYRNVREKKEQETKAKTPLDQIMLFVADMNQLEDVDASFQWGRTNILSIQIKVAFTGSDKEIVEQAAPLVEAFEHLKEHA
jgi:hypothetical protein